MNFACLDQLDYGPFLAEIRTGYAMASVITKCALTDDADIPLKANACCFPKLKINAQQTIGHSVCVREIIAPNFERRMVVASETTLMNCSLGSFYARCLKALFD